MHLPRRITRRIVAVLSLVCLCAAVAYAVGVIQSGRAPWQRPDAARPALAAGRAPDVVPAVEPTQVTSPPTAPTTAPTTAPKPRLTPGPAILARGDDGPRVKDLQARLAQIDWFDATPTGHYGDITAAAVRGFQAKRGFPATGKVDRRTLDRLHAMTHTPTAAELDPNAAHNTAGTLDPRCTTGRVLCIDKTSRTLRWVVDGRVLKTLDTRFGADYSPTREGVFHVYLKDADHVSHLYGSAMPYSMFFSGGQAVHYSSDFAARGYAGASHGCVNIRDHAGIAWLFGQVRVGDEVVVYRS